ncbi:MAG: hypothetical protein M3Y33_04705 [Actinomycetota bacterium]|nr:hypothetical protein [Actinomycetota bacterium]
MITGWLSPEDCPGCGGPLLDVSEGDRLLVLACPGCGYSATWHAADPDDTRELGDQDRPGDLTSPDPQEAE